MPAVSQLMPSGYRMRVESLRAVDVVADGALGVVDRAGEMERATTGLGGEIVELDASGVDEEVTFDRAKASGEIGHAGGSVVDVNAAGDPWVVERTFEAAVDLGGAAAAEAGGEAGEDAKIESAIQAHIESTSAGEFNFAGDLDVGVGAFEGGGLDFETLAGGAEAGPGRRFRAGRWRR